MRLCLLGNRNSIHIARWANGLASRGVEVHLATIHDGDQPLDARVLLHRLPFSAPLGYFLAAPVLRKLLHQIQPDLLNTHYISGYGTLARLAGFHPLLCSVWGSDIYDFPEQSRWKHWLTVRNLAAADAIASTSNAMARQVRRYSKNKPVLITPFGIDHKLFQPPGFSRTSVDLIYIGTVKTLAKKYGVDTLIQAFSLLKHRLDRESSPLVNRLRLLLVGAGPQEQQLKHLAQDLGVAEVTEFTGFVSHKQVPARLCELDIYVALSRLDSESFGVAILEASACERPVVVSDVDGPREVVEHGRTGLIVERDNPAAAADALYQLIQSEEKRKALGKAGRAHVLQHYTWEHSLDVMLNTYTTLIKNG